MSYNLFKQFRDLLPEPSLLVGSVISAQTGRAVVQMPDGAFANVVGEATVGQKVFIRNGVIEGPAPSLTVETIEI